MTSKTQLTLFFFCFLFSLPQISFSQTRDTLVERLIRENGIQSRECYNTVIFDGKLSPLSLLTAKTSFDSLGRPLNYTTYADSSEVSSFLVYFYDDNNNLVKVENRFKDEFNNQTVFFEYNERGLRSRERTVFEGKTNGEMNYIYNEMDLLQERKIEFFDTKKGRKQSVLYEYNQKNQLVKTTFNTHIRDVLEQEYDAEGNVSRVYHFPRKKSKVLFSKREYDEYKQVILRKDHAYRSQNKFDGINNIYIQKGDISIIKTEYFENGLIANETEWLNDVLVSFREFEYLKKPSKSTNN